MLHPIHQSHATRKIKPYRTRRPSALSDMCHPASSICLINLHQNPQGGIELILDTFSSDDNDDRDYWH
jgi:hypothetical protein